MMRKAVDRPWEVILSPRCSTYPGSRLPHAWLDLPRRRKAISTHDLAGKGAFCIFVGVGEIPEGTLLEIWLAPLEFRSMCMKLVFGRNILMSTETGM